MLRGSECEKDGIPECCDITISKYFKNTIELTKWVEENTTLKLGKYMIYGVYYNEDNKGGIINE